MEDVTPVSEGHFEILGGHDGDAEISWPSKFGRYDIGPQLGRGGMAEVFRARVLEGPYAGRTVALKRLRHELTAEPRFVDYFISEADLSRLLHHPNVVEVLEVGEHRGNYYMAMDLIEGCDLGQLIDRCALRRCFLPLEVVLAVAEGLLQALDYVHRLTTAQGQPAELVHCDVTPSNVFLSDTGLVKLADFGIAKVCQLDGAQDGPTLWGTPGYMSPERLGGVLDRSANLWASAVTLFEMLTLRLPFFGKDEAEVKRAVRQSNYPPLTTLRPGLPPALEAVLSRALSIQESERFQTAGEFADALRLQTNIAPARPAELAAFVRWAFHQA